jgi:CheY-like chemotaxis protein
LELDPSGHTSGLAIDEDGKRHGTATASDREICLDAGMDDYLAKPVTSAAHSVSIKRWLGTPDARRIGKGALAVSSPRTTTGDELDTAARPAMFEETALIKRCEGDGELAQAIARSFLTDIPGRIQALLRHLDAGDAKGVESQLTPSRAPPSPWAVRGTRNWRWRWSRLARRETLCPQGPGSRC